MSLAAARTEECEQEVYNEYLTRFERLVKQTEDFSCKIDDATRLRQLEENQQLHVKEVAGDGNCLIWSLLYALVLHGVLPSAAWTREEQRFGTVQACRDALKRKPFDDPLHPKQRDANNAIDRSASAEAHGGAYLEFAAHTNFIVDFLLNETHWQDYGINNLALPTGFVGLSIADLILPWVTFRPFS